MCAGICLCHKLNNIQNCAHLSFQGLRLDFLLFFRPDIFLLCTRSQLAFPATFLDIKSCYVSSKYCICYKNYIQNKIQFETDLQNRFLNKRCKNCFPNLTKRRRHLKAKHQNHLIRKFAHTSACYCRCRVTGTSFLYLAIINYIINFVHLFA